jgi:hypothetical protein
VQLRAPGDVSAWNDLIICALIGHAYKWHIDSEEGLRRQCQSGVRTLAHSPVACVQCCHNRDNVVHRGSNSLISSELPKIPRYSYSVLVSLESRLAAQPAARAIPEGRAANPTLTSPREAGLVVVLLCSCCDHVIRCSAIIKLRGLDVPNQGDDRVCPLVLLQFRMIPSVIRTRLRHRCACTERARNSALVQFGSSSSNAAQHAKLELESRVQTKLLYVGS